MSRALDITIRFTLLALEKSFIYYTDETLDFNINAFLLSCKFKNYDPRICYTLVLETSPNVFMDLANA